MTIKFAIIDPTTREYSFEIDREAAIVTIAQNAVNTYINYYNGGVVCSLVDVQEDGSETWYTQDGVLTPSPDEILRKSLIAIRSKVPMANIPTIPVVTL